MRLSAYYTKALDNVTQQKIAAQADWREKSGQMLPTLRAFLDIGVKYHRSNIAQAGDNRVHTVVNAIALCRAAFGISGRAPVKAPMVLGAFKGVPTAKLSEEIQLAYQLQRFYDLQK